MPKHNICGIFETKNGNIILFFGEEIVVYDKNKNILNKMKLNKTLPIFNDVLDGKFIIISSENENHTKYYINVYNIKTLSLKQTLEVKYPLSIISKFIKLNDNLLITADYFGNIHELNIDNNYELSVKDIFRAHECAISQICKFDDNKVLSISQDGKIKLWEFN